MEWLHHPSLQRKSFQYISAAMPIRLYLAGQRFDPETIRLMGIALESAMVALQPEPMGWTAQARDTVARVIIEQAQAGERDPERLCEAALKALRPSRQGAVTDPNPPPPHASLPHTQGSSS
jgi:hypothetical protein